MGFIQYDSVLCGRVSLTDSLRKKARQDLPMPPVSKHRASPLPRNDLVIILFTLLSIDHEALLLFLLLFILFRPLGDERSVTCQNDVVGVEFFNVLNSTGSVVQQDFQGFWGNAFGDFLLPLEDERGWGNDESCSS